MPKHLCAKLPWHKPGAVQLGCLVALCLAVQEPSVRNSIVAVPVYTPTTSAEHHSLLLLVSLTLAIRTAGRG